MRHIVLLFVLLIVRMLPAQLVSTDPANATRNDSFKVIFNAALGDQGLKGYTGNDVYAHTGVTIEGEGTWQYVIADWSTNLSKARLTKIGTDLWQLDIGNPYAYYGVPSNKKITQLDFVFRNGDGSRTGRDTGGADIFLDLFEPGLTMTIDQPKVDNSFGDDRRTPVFLAIGDTLPIRTIAITIGTRISEQKLYDNGVLVAQTTMDTLNAIFNATSAGLHRFKILGADTAGVPDSTFFSVMVNPPVTDQSRPANIRDGINYLNDNSVVFSLLAPYKKFVYLIGDFNDWRVDSAYYLKRDSIDAGHVYWWIQLENLTPEQEYAFQYLVDGQIRIADPYTEKILDPWNDQYISSATYPALKPYPDGKTEQAVAIVQTAQPAYQWQAQNYQRPDKDGLVIYELLIRDFVARHDFKTLIDTLGYLQRLGVNAIELMPVNEFEGNESWGYNPDFYFAVDKYYGPAADFKAFVDSCHGRNMAVIMDMVLNHSFGQSPFVRLYADGDFGPPNAQNLWYNPDMNPGKAGYQGPHPFGVGYDFNHESPYTRQLVDRINAYWLEEYHVDGFRFDLSKGFTQKYSGDDVSAWGQFDGSRINILERMADQIWSVDPTAYVILEHFSENNEETILAGYGMMLWGNMNYNYNEATMGYTNTSDLTWGYYQSRGWSKNGLVTYMESHDEERLMYKNLQYGNGSGDYSVKDLSTALERMKLAGAFFFTLPGPKMMWQFGELGYDVSIDFNGRVGNKPAHWEYLQQTERHKLFNTWQALLQLRKNHPAFRSSGATVQLSLSGKAKSIVIKNYDLNATIIGNFGVTATTIDPGFTKTGFWYDYFSGDSMLISDTHGQRLLEPGEFHIYTDKPLETPDSGLVPTAIDKKKQILYSFQLKQNYPNPFNPSTVISYRLPRRAEVTVSVFDLQGRLVKILQNGMQTAGRHRLVFNAGNLASGVYIYRLRTEQFSQSRKMLLLR